MAEIRKPPLGDAVYEEISAAQYAVEKTYWEQLQHLLVLPAGAYLANALTGVPIPPKQPIRLGEILKGYARALFDAEAGRYPVDNPDLEMQLENLAERTEIRTIQTSFQGTWAGSLTYHATAETMQEKVHEAIEAHIQTYLHPRIEQAAIVEKQLSPKPATGETVATQISRLREECRLTIEELAERIGIEPRSIQRHESGACLPYTRHLRVYEREFSKLLNRQVVISKLS